MNSNKADNKDYETDIPDHVIGPLAQCILPTLQAYFESKKVNREFADWKRQKNT